MYRLRCKDGSPVNFAEMVVEQHRRWPAALKAAQMVAESILQRKVRTSKGRGVAINGLLQEFMRSSGDTMSANARAQQCSAPPVRCASVAHSVAHSVFHGGHRHRRANVAGRAVSVHRLNLQGSGPVVLRNRGRSPAMSVGVAIVVALRRGLMIAWWRPCPH